MSEFEETATSKLKVGIEGIQSAENAPPMSLAERALKKRRIANATQSRYMDTRYIFPTSNICERLFSTAGFTLSDRRRRLLTCNFEMQIFLHVNSSYWGISDVSRILERQE